VLWGGGSLQAYRIVNRVISLEIPVGSETTTSKRVTDAIEMQLKHRVVTKVKVSDCPTHTPSGLRASSFHGARPPPSPFCCTPI